MASAGSGDETVKAIDVSFGEWGNEICHETKLAPTTSIEPFIAGTRAGRDVAEVRKGGTHGTGWGAESVSVHEAAAGNPPGQKRCRGKCYLWPHNAAPVPGYRMSRRILKLSWDLVCRTSENVSKRPNYIRSCKLY